MSILENITNLRKVIPIYDCNEVFLYEIIEDYKYASTQEEKDEIFNSFCSSLWSSANKRKTYTKAIRFKVAKELLATEPGQVFETWSEIEYNYYKSMTKDENWCAMIRQKINNIYTRYFDKEVILGKEYMDLLKKPKLLYYEWLSGTEMDAAAVTDFIDDVIDQAEKVKKKLQMQKMELSWSEYKRIVEVFLKRCFDNCKLIDEYEDKTKIFSRLDFLTEDHFYVGYINRSISAYFQNYQKDYYSVRRGHSNQYTRCRQCGGIIEKTGNRRMYCNRCAIIRKKESNRKADTKYKNSRRENRNPEFLP